MTRNPIDLQRLLAEEPFVRSLARSLVADEADDVVQQAYLLVLENQPEGVRQPRSWLARIVRNLVTDHRRSNQRRDSRHRSAAVHERVPSSSELVEAEERRRALVVAVDQLPPDQRTVVLLRYYEGLPPRRIAAELGVPVVTVSNRLYAALQTLRRRLDAEHGDRRAWLLPLVPFAALPRAMPWRELAHASAAPALWMGVIAMTTKTKIAAAAAAVLVLAFVWVAWPRDGFPGTRPNAAGAEDLAAARTDWDRGRAGTAADEPKREQVAAPNVSLATTGSLLVHVRYADEPTAVAGLIVTLRRKGGDFRVGIPRAVTDTEGVARFEGLPPGSMWARTTFQQYTNVAVEVEAGATCECTLQLARGMTLNGIVVDPAGVPVGGALVEGSLCGVDDVDADQIAVTTADGTFVVRACETICLVGARAAGYAASHLHYRQGNPGDEGHVRIELRAAGGVVDGIVLGPAGEPVVGAVVRVGEGKTAGILSTNGAAPPLPAQVRTDTTGRFVAIGVPAGSQPVGVRATGLAPWLGTCEVGSGLTVPLRVVLAPGVTCAGIVRGEDGQPAPDIDVGVGGRGDFVLLRTRTHADGTFTLTDLPVGEFVLSASKQRLGKATANLHGQPGATLCCELQLSTGLALRGRVIDDLGAPIDRAEIRCETEDDAARWTNYAFTDEEGRFLVADCPPGRLMTINVVKRDHLPLQRTRVDSLAGELELRLPRDTAPKARISGRLVRPDGRAAAGAYVEAHCGEQGQDGGVVVKDDGSFTIEVLPGEWGLRTQVLHHPEIRVEARTLESGAQWDVGTLQLTRGGTLVVRDAGEAKLEYRVFDTRDRFVCGLSAPVPLLRSDLIAPGDYLLLAHGDGVAAQALSFSIRSEQETELEIHRQAGVRQRFEFVTAAGAKVPSWVGFHLRRDGKLVLYTSAQRKQAGPMKCEVWLAPGSYSLATRNRESPSTALFTIGSEEGAPVRVELR